MMPTILMESVIPLESGDHIQTLEPYIFKDTGISLRHRTPLTNLTEAFLVSVNSSSEGDWRQTDIAMVTVTVVIFVLALVANVLVFVVIGQTHSLQRINSVLQVSLAVSDLCRTVLMPLFTLILLRQQLPGEFCTVYHVFHAFFRVATALNLTAIGLERLVIITSPLNYQRLMTRTKMVVFLVILWLTSALYGALQSLWFQADQKMTIFQHTCEYKPSIGFAIFDSLLFFLGPLVCLLVSYCKIFCVVQSQLKRINPTISDWTLEQSETFQREVSHTTYGSERIQRQSDFQLYQGESQMETISKPGDMVMSISIIPTVESIARTLDTMGTPKSDSHTEQEPDNHIEQEPENHTEQKSDNHTEQEPDNHTEKEPDNNKEQEPDNHTEQEEVQEVTMLPETATDHDFSQTDTEQCTGKNKSTLTKHPTYSNLTEIFTEGTMELLQEAPHDSSSLVDFYIGSVKVELTPSDTDFTRNDQLGTKTNSQPTEHIMLPQSSETTFEISSENIYVPFSEGNHDHKWHDHEPSSEGINSNSEFKKADNAKGHNIMVAKTDTNNEAEADGRSIGKASPNTLTIQAKDNVSYDVIPNYNSRESPVKHALPAYILEDLDIPDSILDRRASKVSVVITEASQESTDSTSEVHAECKQASRDISETPGSETKELKPPVENEIQALELDSKELIRSDPTATETLTAETKAKIFMTTSSQQSSGYHSQISGKDETAALAPMDGANRGRRPSALKRSRTGDRQDCPTSGRRRGSVSFKAYDEEILPDRSLSLSPSNVSLQAQPIRTVLRDTGSGESETTTLETSLSSGREPRTLGSAGTEPRRSVGMDPGQRHTRQWARQHFNVVVSDSDTVVPTLRLSLPSNSMISTRSRPRTGSSRVTDNKAVKMTLAVVGALVLTWLPYQITFIMRRANPDLVSTLAWNITNLLHYTSAAINPLVYNFYAGEFRRALKRIILCRPKSDFPWA